MYENEVTVLSSPTYSPDIVSPDLFLLPILKLNVPLKASLSGGLKVRVSAVIHAFGPSGAVLGQMINKHTTISLIFITFPSHYFFTAQYFHKGLHCGVYVPECVFPFLCMCSWGFLCTASLGRKFYGSFRIQLFPKILFNKAELEGSSTSTICIGRV